MFYIISTVLLFSTGKEIMIARMRTIPKAYQETKELDPHTCLTLRALRHMVNNGEIAVIQIASKKLINLDLLLEKLACYNNDAA